MQDAPIQKPLELVLIDPPPVEQRTRREADFAPDPSKKTRYSMPYELDSASPVGYRTRVSFTPEEAEEILPLLSLDRPSSFLADPDPILEREMFEECSLGTLSARQSTNFRGHRQATLGPETSREIAEAMRRLDGVEAEVLDNATHTHLVFARPYRTPFTFLLTFIGHQPIKSLLTVPKRALDKRIKHVDDIPTVGYLQHLHIGVLADAMERAAIIASGGRRMAQVFLAPFTSDRRARNETVLRDLERIGGLTAADRAQGWRLALVAQVGEVPEAERIEAAPQTFRKLGANLLAFRSERIQPGVNQEKSAPEGYHKRQEMDVPDELTVQCGRAAYNAFVHWTGIGRNRSKELVLMERVDVLTPTGKERLRDIREDLEDVADKTISGIPKWADIPTGKALSRNAARGKKAFALAGQRIYIGGLDRHVVEAEGLDFELALRAFGATSARSALFAELMGATNVPDDCDLLGGICLMAGPVNQNDIGKEFFGKRDLLADAFPGQNPTSLIVWTLKAKTIADPIGNEEQLLNAARKGALVDLRPGPHEVCVIGERGSLAPMRQKGEVVNRERAFSDIGNFVISVGGDEIPGNRGDVWSGGDSKVW